jgi:hypothetical protein
MAPRLTHAPAPAIDDAFPAKGAFAARLRAGRSARLRGVWPTRQSRPRHML